MDQANLLLRIHQHYKDKLPFVCYCLADSNKVKSIFQTTKKINTTSEEEVSGFIMAPFEFKGEFFVIPTSAADSCETTLENKKFEYISISPKEAPEERKNYLEVLSEALLAIKGDMLQKVVMSRPVDLQLSKFDFNILYQNLFTGSQTAMRYIWYHPETGIWCGATPETLLEIEGSTFYTMALAGTQAIKENQKPYWTKKEYEEQQIVTDAIVSDLQKFTSVLKVSNTNNHLAGTLVHLRTDITGVLKGSRVMLTRLISALHPTPAVCGYPKESAREYIEKHEGYEREYYTGFLGPVNTEPDSSRLFVNLRCMKINEQSARIYVGGGITAASDPGSEWDETQNKLQTMLQVIAPLL